LGDGKGIWPVKKPAVHEGISPGDFQGPGLTWSDLWKKGRLKNLKKQTKVVVVTATYNSNKDNNNLRPLHK